MRLHIISFICASFFLFSGCSLLKVNFTNKEDVVGEWLLEGVAGSDRVYEAFPRREILLLSKNDNCILTSRDQVIRKGTYKLDGHYLTINLKSGWIERYQIVSLRGRKMEVSATSHQSDFVPSPGGFLSWQKLEEN